MWMLSKRRLLVLLEDLARTAWVLLEGWKALSMSSFASCTSWSKRGREIKTGVVATVSSSAPALISGDTSLVSC